MKANTIQNSFNAGELSPLVYARSDIAKYKNALYKLLNAFPLIQGGWTRRPGTYYVAPTKANGVARLQRFEFSTTQAYQIEFGDLYARFYKDHGVITETALVITGITQANPGVLTYTGTDPSNGDDIELSGIVGMTQLNGRRVTVANVNAGANTFELKDPDGTTNINTTGYTAYSSGGSAAKVYTVTTPYATAHLFELKFAQSNDTLYITHPSYAPRKLTRTAHNAWTLTVIPFTEGPYLELNTTSTTISFGAATGTGPISIPVTSSTPIFASTDAGRLFTFKTSTTWGRGYISAYTDTSNVTIVIPGPVAGTFTATTNWRLGIWSDTTGYPSCICFYEDRLCFAGALSSPQRIDMSKSSEYENFGPSNVDGTVGDADAVSVTLNSSDVNVIRWMEGNEKGIVCGTVGGEWLVRASTAGEALTPGNVNAKRSSTYGSANVQSIRAGEATLYLQRAGRKLREFSYAFQSDSFSSPDMTVLSEHITLGGLVQLAYQKEPQSTVWAPRADGALVGFTYEREQQVLGWHRHTLGGYYDADHLVRAKVESVSCIPAPDISRDESWIIVNRYVNGKTRRYIEYSKKAWERGDLQSDAYYVDCGLSLNNTIAQTLTPGTGATVKTTTGVIFTAGGAIFAAGDVGRYIHYDYVTIEGEQIRASALITGYTDTTHVTATILSPWPTLNLIASAGWRMTVTTVTGLWHLEGETVQVFADGATHPEATIASGSITLTYPASKISIGLGYESDGQNLRIDAGAKDGTTQGKIRRIHDLAMLFHDSVGVKIGPDFDHLVRQTFRKTSDYAGVAPPLFSGIKEFPWEGDYDTEGYVCWRQDQPEPLTVLAILPSLKVSDK